MGKEQLVYKPPNVAQKYQLRLLPLITVQCETGTTNFQQVSKAVVADPETQLTLPSWELRTPSEDELAEEKRFEEEEAKWDDEYWKKVAKFRQMMEAGTAPRHERSSSSGSVRRLPDKSFQRADSFRMDGKLASSPTGPRSSQSRRNVAKVDVRHSKSSSIGRQDVNRSAKRSGSTQSVDTIPIEAEPMSSPPTPPPYDRESSLATFEGDVGESPAPKATDVSSSPATPISMELPLADEPLVQPLPGPSEAAVGCVIVDEQLSSKTVSLSSFRVLENFVQGCAWNCPVRRRKVRPRKMILPLKPCTGVAAANVGNPFTKQ